MNAKTTIKKILFIAVWLCIGGGMVTLLLAAITKKKQGLCADYTIVFKGKPTNLFIDQKDVQQLLMKATAGKIKGESIASFDLFMLEKMLEHNNWINDAELYFDNQDVLYVTVTEKEPVARIFTVAGNSFYLDSLGRKMPLSDRLSARVPVFTGFPEKKILSAKDSLLLNDVRTTANFIVNDPFWMAQVAQVDINENGTFDMIPLVGNHLVKLGDGNNIEKKFHRLMIFYKQVLSKTGFDKYKVIDVQYNRQIVVSKQAGDIHVDSVQLRKNVEKLLRQSIEAENDTTMKVLPASKYQLDIDSTTTDNFNKPDNTTDKKITNPNPVKAISLSYPKPEKDNPFSESNVNIKKSEKPKQTVKENRPKPAVKKKEVKNEPKAVMPKKTVEEMNGGYN
ncbi:MAG: hypothetical protein ABIU11_03445 [Chitinophagaceae bacterium]